MKNIDITGIRFGRLVALKRNDEITKKRKTIYWDFLCDCGQIETLNKYSVIKRGVSMCSKCRNPDITGKKFNKLTAICFSYNKQTKSRKTSYWKFRCDCGKEIIRARGDVVKGNTKSCGCQTKLLMTESKKIHGYSHTRLYEIYKLMIRRCYNKNMKGFKNYGGRGIKVCEEWKKDFLSFRCWALDNGYKEDLTIDRIDNDGDYCPENCRWATKKEQANNKRNNKILFYKGKKQSLSKWAKELNINYNKLRSRLQYGWSVERAFNE